MDSNDSSPQGGSIDLKLFKSLSQCEDLWEKLQPRHDVFLQIPFLKAIEEHGPADIRNYFGVIFNEGIPEGIMLFQIKEFRVGTSIQSDKSGLWQSFKERLTANVGGGMLIGGNLLLTGRHGLYFPNREMSRPLYWNKVKRLYSDAFSDIREFDEDPSIFLAKDFYGGLDESGFTPDGLSGFEIQPNMVTFLQPEWRSFDDYMTALRSKYRIRLKKAVERAKSLDLFEWDYSQISNSAHEIHQLYLNVSEEANFNLFKLRPTYWAALKEALGDSFRFFTYQSEGRVIGFFTLISQGPELNAHFLGYTSNALKDNDIYLNMLVHLIRVGIEDRKRWVMMSRTAMEIKSSVGAVPINMFCLYSHRSKVIRNVFPYLLKWLNPTREWDQRHPFKRGSEPQLPDNFTGLEKGMIN